MKQLRNALSLLLVLLLAAGLLPMTAQAARNPFVDVGESDFCHDAVLWAYSHTPQIAQGVDASHFDPNGTVTRGQAVTFLWRAVNCPAPAAGNNPFADVGSGDYYCQPVLWAVERGVTVGTDADHFSPADTCSTAHILTFLYRALGVGFNGWDGEAARWADELSLLDGTGLSFSADQRCPRGAVVTFLYRALEDAEPPVTGPDASSRSNRTPSTAVTASDYAILSSQATDVPAGTDAPVNFRLVSSLVVPSFALFLNGADVDVKLTDDNADGVYTGSFTVRQPGDNILRFTARATVAGQTVESNVSQVQVTMPLAPDTVAALEELTAGLGQVLRDVNAAGAGQSAEALAQTRLAAAKEYLSGRAETETSSDEPYTLYYTVGDLRLAVDCQSPDEAGQAAPLRAGELVLTPQSEAESWYIRDAERALVLSGYSGNGAGDDADQLRGATRVVNTLRDVGFQTACRFGATLRDYRNLERYAVLSLHGGGALRRGEPTLRTCPPADGPHFARESADLRRERVLICTYADGSTAYELLPAFFRHYYKESGRTLSATLVLLGGSCGCANDALALALRESGAATVLGFSGPVHSAYSKHMLVSVLEQLRTGKDLGSAVGKAASIWGDSDQNGTALRIEGSERELLHAQLQNGGFQSGSEGWVSAGALAVQAEYLKVKAPDGHMAALSTGAGAASDERFSAMYQVVLVPQGAKTLKYQYNVATEERSRPGGIKADCFRAAAMKPDGTVDQLLSNILTGNARFKSYTADRIHENTPLFATGFFQAKRDISAWQGKLLILCFWVKDRDDSSYDTVAMLDNVKIQ